jgi:hypothetical protein
MIDDLIHLRQTCDAVHGRADGRLCVAAGVHFYKAKEKAVLRGVRCVRRRVRGVYTDWFAVKPDHYTQAKFRGW